LGELVPKLIIGSQVYWVNSISVFLKPARPSYSSTCQDQQGRLGLEIVFCVHIIDFAFFILPEVETALINSCMINKQERKIDKTRIMFRLIFLNVKKYLNDVNVFFCKKKNCSKLFED